MNIFLFICMINTEKRFLLKYIYIYIYICVCVCDGNGREEGAFISDPFLPPITIWYYVQAYETEMPLAYMEYNLALSLLWCYVLAVCHQYFKLVDDAYDLYVFYLR